MLSLSDGKPVPEHMPRARPVELALDVIAFRPAKLGPRGARIRRSCRLEAVGNEDRRRNTAILLGRVDGFLDYLGMLTSYLTASRARELDRRPFDKPAKHCPTHVFPVFHYDLAAQRDDLRNASHRHAFVQGVVDAVMHRR